jgi:5-methyltetrahydropteroyltriglutamate--homocysteine methyltransferase
MSNAPTTTAEAAKIPAAREPRRPARAETIGSLLRPARLKSAMEGVYEPGHSAILDEERGKDLGELHAIENEEIRRAVERQIAAGLDVVTDGEYRRFMFTNSFFDSLSGLVADDMKLEFRGDDGSVVTYTGTPVISARVQAVDNPAVREIEFLRSVTDFPFKVTFPAASFLTMPWTFRPGITDKAYSSRQELAAHVIEVLRGLVMEAIDAGATYIQFDYPSYPHIVDERWHEPIRLTGGDPATLLGESIAADTEVLKGIPDHVTTALHVCRGNHRSRWLCEGSLEPVAERMFSELPYDVFLVEWEDATRDGGYDPIRFVPKGPTLVLGIVSSKLRDLEPDDLVLQRIDEASAFLDVNQLAISTQCGFASTVEGNELSEDDQWAKLDLVGRVAERVWG